MRAEEVIAKLVASDKAERERCVLDKSEVQMLLDEIDRLQRLTSQRRELYEEVRHAYRMGWLQDDSDRPLKILAALRGESWPG